MDDRGRQIDEMGEAQYALECILARLSEEEFLRVYDDLPPRAREHVRLTAADYPGGAVKGWAGEANKGDAETDDMPFGACPECGKSDGYRNICRLHFFYCDEHRLTWCAGSDLMGSWREEGEEDWRSAWEHLKGYRTVDGFGRYAPGPPLEELTTLKKLLAGR